jgi:hypothetical protein
VQTVGAVRERRATGAKRRGRHQTRAAAKCRCRQWAAGAHYADARDVRVSRWGLRAGRASGARTTRAGHVQRGRGGYKEWWARDMGGARDVDRARRRWGWMGKVTRRTRHGWGARNVDETRAMQTGLRDGERAVRNTMHAGRTLHKANSMWPGVWAVDWTSRRPGAAAMRCGGQ